jgi:hypothetical protein
MSYSIKTAKERKNEISSECRPGMIKKERDILHTRFLSALFNQLSVELLVVGQKDLVQLAYLLQLIFEELSFSKSLKSNPQELIFRSRMFN